MRAGPSGARRRPSRLQRHDRFRLADPSGDPGELARVSKRLKIERDHRGPFVALEVAEQVVRADVELVPDGDEARQTEAGDAGLLGEHDSDRTGLRDERKAPRERIKCGEGRVHPDLGVGVQDSKTVRTDDAHALPPSDPEQLSLDLGTGAARLTETRGDHGHRAYAGRSSFAENTRNCRWRYRDDREIDQLRKR